VDIYKTVKKFYETATTEKRVIGKSLLGRDIYAFKIGDGSPVGIAQYAMHGREFITARLALRHIRVGVPQGSVWVIPLVNPDGALLSERGLDSVADERRREYLLKLNDQSPDFSLWKANARGVDLNVNFDARWGTGRKNTRLAGRENGIGAKPFSEPETTALKKFTEETNPDYTVSYHTKGEEIYWYFYQEESDCVRDKALAERIASETGYPLRYAKGSAGGYKDWCIEKFKIPSFTIEAGNDLLSHPIRKTGDIIKKNEKVLYELAKAVKALR
jgi:g-D-glutamyl-meso-diaminopimelate peptidase